MDKTLSLSLCSKRIDRLLFTSKTGGQAEEILTNVGLAQQMTTWALPGSLLSVRMFKQNNSVNPNSTSKSNWNFSTSGRKERHWARKDQRLR